MYEYIGNVPGVTFPTGIIVDPATAMVRLYYGAADNSVAVATADLNDILIALKNGV
jgi:predicted GH43/DUF377 family glycosyl hydrolase